MKIFIYILGLKHKKLKKLYVSFYVYIYPPDLQESNRGTIHRASNYPDLLSQMSGYCCPIEIFYFLFLVFREL